MRIKYDFKQKFKIGDKVVPIKKTIIMIPGGTEEQAIERTLKGQPFCYIVRVGYQGMRYGGDYLVSAKKDHDTGDIYMHDELIPYEER